MDKSAEIKPKFFWYRDRSRRIRKVRDKRIRPWWNVSSPLSRASCISRRHLDIIRGTCQLLYTDIYFLAYLLRPSGSLADCTTLLRPQPPRSSASNRSISPSKELERPKENIIVSHSLLLRGLVITFQIKLDTTYNSFTSQLYSYTLRGN